MVADPLDPSLTLVVTDVAGVGIVTVCNVAVGFFAVDVVVVVVVGGGGGVAGSVGGTAGDVGIILKYKRAL